MLILILTIVVALVAWALYLMQQAIDRREFSLMLAGTLVAFSAAAMMGVYFLVGDYVAYASQMSHPAAESIAWYEQYPMIEVNSSIEVTQPEQPLVTPVSSPPQRRNFL